MGSHRAYKHLWLWAITLAIALVAAACGSKAQKSEPPSSGSEWHEFQGTWTAAGSRYILAFGDDRRSAISHFTGSLVLSGSSRSEIGFRAEAIVFNDTTTGMVGRAVWTDERGQQIFSELRGEGTATNNKIVGTFDGGTGRYAGATGSYGVSWRFLLETEDGSVQGHSIGLNGRVRVGQPQKVPDIGGPQS